MRCLGCYPCMTQTEAGNAVPSSCLVKTSCFTHTEHWFCLPCAAQRHSAAVPSRKRTGFRGKPWLLLQRYQSMSNCLLHTSQQTYVWHALCCSTFSLYGHSQITSHICLLWLHNQTDVGVLIVYLMGQRVAPLLGALSSTSSVQLYLVKCLVRLFVNSSCNLLTYCNIGDRTLIQRRRT